MKTILITGGLGYVGGRLTQYFAEEKGYLVVALSRQSIKEPFHPNITLKHPDEILNSDHQLKVDVLIHLAALNEHDCVSKPMEAIEVNIGGTVKWLEWALDNQVEHFIYFSTAHVYGKPLAGTLTEDRITTPVHPYAITHKAAEDYVYAYWHEKGLPTTIVRLSNSFGYPAYPTANRWSLLVNDLCKMAVEKGKLVLNSDGSQLRDFVTLQDVCLAVQVLIDNKNQAPGEIYNLGLGKSLSVFEMSKFIQTVAMDVLSNDLQLERKESTGNIISPFEFNCEKLKSLGWKPLDNINEEIKRTLFFFKN